jgi:hypothetical protein
MILARMEDLSQLKEQNNLIRIRTRDFPSLPQFLSLYSRVFGMVLKIKIISLNSISQLFFVAEICFQWGTNWYFMYKSDEFPSSNG